MKCKYNNKFYLCEVNNTDILIIGGGASGMMAAITAAEAGKKVILLEKRPNCGTKLLITGKGRCNLTNMNPWPDFSPHVHNNASFFKPAFYNFSNQDTLDFFEKSGMPTQVQRGNRAYPASERSRDVLDTLLRRMRALQVDIRYNSSVSSITVNGNADPVAPDTSRFSVSCIDSKNDRAGRHLALAVYTAKALIVATGGLSYPLTGSTGDGYKFAKQLGHKVTSTLPSLTALKPKKYSSDFHNISLRNIRMDLYVNENMEQSEFGEMTFTNGGIEGALGFRLSRRAVKGVANGQKVYVILDLKPAVSVEQLKNRLNGIIIDLKISQREVSHTSERVMKQVLAKFMPRNLIQPFLSYNEGINIEKLPVALKNWRFDIVSYVGYERCVITNGGVSIKEISRKTMESKKIKHLYFSGEIIDLDADTGGYNLQIAFSTGVLAGRAAAADL